MLPLISLLFYFEYHKGLSIAGEVWACLIVGTWQSNHTAHLLHIYSIGKHMVDHFLSKLHTIYEYVILYILSLYGIYSYAEKTNIAYDTRSTDKNLYKYFM